MQLCILHVAMQHRVAFACKRQRSKHVQVAQREAVIGRLEHKLRDTEAQAASDVADLRAELQRGENRATEGVQAVQQRRCAEVRILSAATANEHQLHY